MSESEPKNEPTEIALNKQQFRTIESMVRAIISSSENTTEKLDPLARTIHQMTNVLENTSSQTCNKTRELTDESTSLKGSTVNLTESTNQLRGQMRDLSEVIHGLRASIVDLTEAIHRR